MSSYCLGEDLPLSFLTGKGFESWEAMSSKIANNFKSSAITPAVTPQSDLLLDCQQLAQPDRPNGDEWDS